MIENLIEFIIRNWIFFAIIGVLLYVLWVQRRKVTRFNSVDDFEALVNAGYPVVAEFFDHT